MINLNGILFIRFHIGNGNRFATAIQRYEGMLNVYKTAISPYIHLLQLSLYLSELQVILKQ